MSKYLKMCCPLCNKYGENDLPHGISDPLNHRISPKNRRRRKEEEIEASETRQLESTERTLACMHKTVEQWQKQLNRLQSDKENSLVPASKSEARPSQLQNYVEKINKAERQVENITHSEKEKQINKNLELISSLSTRLKELATKFGDAIDEPR